MSIDITTEQQPTRQALAIEGRSGRLKVTGKLKVAVDAMVFDGLRRKEAAEKAKLTDHSLRAAMLKPHVRQYLSQQFDVLRESSRIRAHIRLEEISEQDKNLNAAVIAAKALIGDTDQQVSQRQSAPAPGVVIVIEQRHDMSHVGDNQAKPLIDMKVDSER